MIQAAERCFSVISTIQFLVRSSLVILVITLHSRESVGVMVMCWTLNKEVLGPIPTGFTVLCP